MHTKKHKDTHTHTEGSWVSHLCHSAAFSLVHQWVEWRGEEVKDLGQSWKWPLMLNWNVVLLGGHSAYCNSAINDMLRLRVTHTNACAHVPIEPLRESVSLCEHEKGPDVSALHRLVYSIFPLLHHDPFCTVLVLFHCWERAGQLNLYLMYSLLRDITCATDHRAMWCATCNLEADWYISKLI